MYMFGVPSKKPQSKPNFTYCKTWANTYIVVSLHAHIYERCIHKHTHTQLHPHTHAFPCPQQTLEGCFIVIPKLNIYINLMNPPQTKWTDSAVNLIIYVYIIGHIAYSMYIHTFVYLLYVCQSTIALFMPLDPNSDTVFRDLFFQSRYPASLIQI